MKLELCTTTNPVLEIKMAQQMPLVVHTSQKVSYTENNWHLQRQVVNYSDPLKTKAATANQENKIRK